MLLQDTLQICADALYRSRLGPALILEALFLEFIHLTTKRVEFSFDNMYAQIHGISMGSPLGPVLVNIFVRFYESLFFEKNSKSYVYLP